jgi:thiamine-monophosphate kinase
MPKATIAELGERELIRRFIAPLIVNENGTYLLDDCAIIDIRSSTPLLLSTDQGPNRTFLELLNVGTPADIGHFNVTVNASDIAAMGGIPLGMLMVLALKGDESLDYLADFLHGVREAMEEYGIRLWGGDTKQADARSTTITIVGRAHEGGALTRLGTCVGDEVFVTPGQIGSTLRSYILAARGTGRSVIERPIAKISFGQKLSAAKIATSCMDMSDGIIATAEQLAQINNLTLALDVDALPLAESPRPDQSARWRDLVLNVGGDFGLMFTTSPQNVGCAQRLGGQHIGTVMEAKSEWINKSTLNQLGVQVRPWEQFKTTESISDEIRSFV